jgi:chemotaxis protein histidine kinase CheA
MPPDASRPPSAPRAGWTPASPSGCARPPRCRKRPGHAASSISTEGDRIRIVVADDGEGFDACEHTRRFDTTGGFGLFAIREMCAQVGGRFEIESSAGKGARAVLSVPLG